MLLHDATNQNGLFDIQGKLFAALTALNTARGSTVPTSFAGFNTFYAKLTATIVSEDQELNNPTVAPLTTWQQGGSTLTSWAQQRASQLLAAFVDADGPQPAAGDDNNLAVLLADMAAGSYYVTPSTVTTSLAPAAGNSGTDLLIVHTPNRGDGRNNQHCLPEALTITVSSAATAAGLQIVGPQAEGDALAQDWPLGSGTNTGISATDPASSLLPNGNFETDTTPNVPDGWLIVTGTPGTTVKISPVAVQTVTISGSPTGSFWILEFTAGGTTYATTVLPFNATANQVQTALAAIPGLAGVTVTASGTSPNTTFTITFNGVAGDLANLTFVNKLTGGTPAIVVATVTHGDAAAVKGQALIFASNGSELTAVYSPPLNLQPDTVYFCAFRSRRVGLTAAGQLAAEIVGSIGGSALLDDSANACQLLITASTVSVGPADAHWFSFRLPAAQTGPVYLRLRFSAAVDNGCAIYWDEAAIFQGQELYAGGPFVGAVAGAVVPLLSDRWTLTVANDRAGLLHEWYNRTFGLAGKRLLLPSSGSNLIPNSVVS